MAKIIILSLCLLLSGCGVYKSKFDCPAGQGAGCVPVSKVQRLVKSNSLDEYIKSRSDNRAKQNKNYQGSMRLDHHIADGMMVVHFNEYLGSNGLIQPEKSLTIRLDNYAG